MRFVFLSYNYSPDICSPQEWVGRLKFYVGSLEALSKEHEVIRVDQINYEGEFVHNGVKYFCVNDGKKKNLFPRKLNQFVRSLNPGCVMVSSFLFPLQVIQLRKTLGKNVKLIIQNHADKPFTGIKKYLQRSASKSVDAFIFASREMGVDWVTKGNIVDKRKIHEIVGGSSVFYPIAKKDAREKTGINGDPAFLWVGRLNVNKDPLNVVNSFLEFVDRQPTAKLYMIYQTTELLTAIQEIKTQHQNGNAIILIGKINNEELLYWFNSADFYVSASHYEGGGTALEEAMSCGCIPVVTDIFSFRAITNNGDCGILYEPANRVALVAALQRSIQLDKEKESKKSIDHFNNALSFSAIAEKFAALAISL